MSNDTQPEIRFPGFTDDWEERKLGDEVRIVMGQSPNSENYTDDPNDYILVQGNADMKNGRVFPRVWTTQVTKQAEKDDLILSVRAPVGDIGKTAYDVVIGRGVAAIKGNEFIFQNLGKMKSDGYWTRYSTGSTFESINSTDIKEAIISVPTIEEQNKIGSFFKQLDNTIALHQRKLDLLKETKKGFLQKMFPKNGAKVPEVRFPGFTEDWEERKLSELAEVKTGFPFKNDDFIDGGDYLVITNGNIQNNSALVDGNIGNRISAVSDEIKDKYLLNYGDILVTMDGTVGRTAKVFEKNQILAQRVGRLVANTTPEFLYQWLNTGKFFGDMTKVSHGGTIKHISLSEISDFNAFVPVNEDERVKIGSLLLNIDKTITLHQRKLDLLKETKKGFLQKMFV
ncbi:restriction endonuclease subunit S [Enterococcus faecium]|uniref:restriction endonuclease subunit S n=3 Tax=Enterococcus faecium TaxID=1352 RepID=UPI003D0CFFD3